MPITSIILAVVSFALLDFVFVYVKTQKQLLQLHKKNQEFQHLLGDNFRPAIVGEMARHVTHELSTPLSIISLRAEQLQMEFKKDENFDREKVKKSVENIEQTTKRIAEAVSRLRNFVRESSHEAPGAVSLYSVVQNAMDLSREKFKYDQVLFANEVSSSFELQGHSADFCYLLFSVFVKGLEPVADSGEKKVSINAIENENALELSVTAVGFCQVSPESHYLKVAEMICQNYGASLTCVEVSGNPVWKMLFPSSIVTFSDLPAVA